MKKSLSLLLAFMMVLSLCPAFSVAAASYEISPGIGTLQRAVDAVPEGSSLILKEGTYYLEETLEIPRSITIKAKEGANVTLTGSYPLTGWESVGDGIYRAPYSESTLPMLIESGTTATIARFPNAPAEPKFTDGYIFATSASYTEGATSGSVTFSETLPTGIAAENLEMICWGSAETNYANSVVNVSSISSGQITFKGEVKYGVTASSRFYIRGDKALIDEVGEYALSDGYIYYKPRSSANLETSVTASRAFGEVIRVLADNVVLSGLSIKGTALGFSGENTALGLYGSSICVDNLTFDGIGSRAINMGGAGNTVQNSTFRNIGSEAITVNGANQLVRNNDIAATGKENGGGAAITLASQNSTVSNNKITNAPRWGINISYGDFRGNVIEYNDLSNCNTDSSDTALIYMYYTKGTPESPNIIRYNKVHDSNIYGGMGFGIYLDDNCDYFEIYGNILYNLGYDNLGYVAGIIMVKGVGNDIHHNIIANNQNNPVRYDASNFHGAGNIFVQKLNPQTSVTLQNKMHHNVFYENMNNTMYCVYHSEPLDAIAECDYNLYYASENRGGDGNSKYHVNVVDAWGDMRYGWQTSFGFDTHSLFDTDPLFVDGANNDFRLTEDSPLWDMGWEENLPIEQMGLLAEDTAIPEALPTAVPNEYVPLPTADPTKHLLSMTGIYKENGANNDRTTYESGTLHMIKDYTGGGDVLVWADAAKTLSDDTTYTLSFEASVSGGYAESPWDGYHVYLRNYSVNLSELIHLYSMADGRTGVKSGSQTAVVEAGTHAFELVYTKDSVAVYCDGEYLFTNNALGFTGDLHCYQIENGHPDATYAELTLSNLNVYAGDVHTVIDPSATAAPTAEPTATPAPTAAPTARPTADPSEALLTMTGIYKENGANNDRTTYADGTLSMVKDYAGMGDVLVWANDDIKTVTDDTVYTVSFRATVSGGQAGNSWDGYSICLRNYEYNAFSLVHISTLSDGRTGISAKPGDTPVAVSAGEHFYEVVYTASSVNVYCDGVLVLENNEYDFTGDLHCFQIQNGHTDATGSTLTLSDFAVYEGDVSVAEAPSITLGSLTGSTFTATLTKPETGGILVVAEFDGDGKFLCFTTYEAEETVSVTLSSSAHSAKVMWWNTVSGMTPISEMKSISK